MQGGLREKVQQVSNTVLREARKALRGAECPEWGKRKKRCLWNREPGSGPAEPVGHDKVSDCIAHAKSLCSFHI